MRATIKDIAREIGVNVATISRALNNKPGVSAELQRKIQKKALEMHYSPHGQARGLVTQRTETIGLIFDSETSSFLSNPFYGGVLAGIESELRRHNFSLMFSSTGGHKLDSVADLPKFIIEHRVDGVLIVGSIDERNIRLLHEVQLPMLMIDYHLEENPIDTVIVDNRRAGKMLTDYLVGLGHRHIAFVGGRPLDEGNFYERLCGYRDALQEHEIPYRRELIQEGELEGGYESAQQVLARAPEVTAIMACNDANACAAMRAMVSKSLRVPEDISIAGFDDIAAAAESWPPLTTVRVDKCAMGRTAAQRLLQKLKNDDTTPPYETVFPTEVVRRASTAAPRK
ncbi:MAG: LacI family transcriptional regulator [Spartobacteria bacterium]|nr:LacI family transcriptional regulator [Spartobacteria bacterium]